MTAHDFADLFDVRRAIAGRHVGDISEGVTGAPARSAAHMATRGINVLRTSARLAMNQLSARQHPCFTQSRGFA